MKTNYSPAVFLYVPEDLPTREYPCYDCPHSSPDTDALSHMLHAKQGKHRCHNNERIGCVGNRLVYKNGEDFPIASKMADKLVEMNAMRR